jgi:hypothetical protein
MSEIPYKFNCDKCNYHTNISSSYKKHLEGTLHITGKRKIRKDKQQTEDFYKCDKCDYTTINEHNYKSHMLNNHSSREDKKAGFKYYCEACDFGTYIEPCYKTHLETKKHKIRSIENIILCTHL